MSYTQDRINQINAAYEKGGRLAKSKPIDRKAERRIAGQAAGWKAQGLPIPSRPVPKQCECCGRRPDKKALALDHDHNTGLFRGFICDSCNRGIGMLGDNKAGVRRALSYLSHIELSGVECHENQWQATDITMWPHNSDCRTNMVQPTDIQH